MKTERAVANKLLASERDNLRTAKATVDQVVSSVLARVALLTSFDDKVDARAGQRSVALAIPALSAALADALMTVRSDARSDGRASIAIDLDDDVDAASLPDQSGEDYARALAAAAAFAAFWGATAIQKIKKVAPRRIGTGTGIRFALTSSVRDTAPRLERIVSTETVHAFNSERQAAAEVIDARGPGLAKAQTDGPYRAPGRAAEDPGVTRFWSAILDAATCQRCASLNGIVRGIGESFPEGLEPPVHPFCRCIIVYDYRTASKPRAA